MKLINKFFLHYILGIFLSYLIANYANSNDIEELNQIELYLNSLKHIAGTFTQVDANDNTQTGSFFLSRPGKLKWEYREPKKITILFKENQVFYYDKDLDQRSEYKSQDSLIYLLVAPKIDFHNEFSAYYLQSFGRTNKHTELEIKRKGQSKDETLILKLSNNPIKLVSVGLKGSVNIFIDSIIEYQTLDKNLFTT